MTGSSQRRILSLAQVQNLVPLSRSQLYRLEKEGLFPRRIRVGKRRIGWDSLAIDQWRDAKLEA